MIVRLFLLASIVAALLISVCASAIQCDTDSAAPSKPKVYRYKIHKAYPHRPGAFTQGLVYDNGQLYESTGQYGFSSLSEIALDSGEVLQNHPLTKTYFGEGLALWQDQLIQLTWKSGKVFRYRRDNLELLEEHTILGEGWGITHNGQSLITSNGTQTLSFRDPKTLAVHSSVDVHYLGRPLKKLNELEWVNRCVLANIWQSQYIAIIDPTSGTTRGLIDLTPIIQHEQKAGTPGVANGIALLPENQHLLVTGKYWQRIYEIEIIDPE